MVFPISLPNIEKLESSQRDATSSILMAYEISLSRSAVRIYGELASACETPPAWISSKQFYRFGVKNLHIHLQSSAYTLFSGIENACTVLMLYTCRVLRFTAKQKHSLCVACSERTRLHASRVKQYAPFTIQHLHSPYDAHNARSQEALESTDFSMSSLMSYVTKVESET